MKALSMLDHVMLWVARGFAAYAVFFAIINLGGRIDGMIIFGSFLIVSILWLVYTCARQFPSLSVFVGITSVLCLFILLDQAVSDFRYGILDSFDLTFIISMLLGSTALIWTTLRPLKKSANQQTLNHSPQSR